MSKEKQKESLLADLSAVFKKYFSSEKPSKDVKVKAISFKAEPEWFKEVKAKDGVTMISYDGEMPEMGMPIFVINPDNGERLAMPDGVVELEDGTKIETMGGLVQAIVPAGAPTEEKTPPAADMTKETGEQTAKRIIESITKESHFTDTVKALIADAEKASEQKFSAERTAAKAENDALVKQLAETKTAFAALEEKFKKFEAFSSDLASKLEAFGGTPQTSAEKKEKEFREEKKAPLTEKEWKEKYIK